MMEAANRDLETKLTHVRITRDKTEGVLASRNANRIKRHKDALYCVVSSVERAKRKVEELKITAGEELPAITLWGDKLEEQIAAVDDYMDRISRCLAQIDQKQLDKTRKDQLDFEKGAV